VDDTSCTSVQTPVDKPNVEAKPQSEEMASSRLRDSKGNEVSRGLDVAPQILIPYLRDLNLNIKIKLIYMYRYNINSWGIYEVI